MQFGMCHFAYLAKYAIWRKKKCKNTHFYYFTFGAPYSITAWSFGEARYRVKYNGCNIGHALIELHAIFYYKFCEACDDLGSI